jgi:hypothetical protein
MRAHIMYLLEDGHVCPVSGRAMSSERKATILTEFNTELSQLAIVESITI